MSDTIIFKSSSDSNLDSKERVVKRTYTQDVEEEYTVKELEAKIAYIESNMSKCSQCQSLSSKLTSLKTILSNTKTELSIS
tara:strand:+ start:2131 stop:2373 length:243 start_codon:yes stop_codon:yes gene_type:complete